MQEVKCFVICGVWDYNLFCEVFYLLRYIDLFAGMGGLRLGLEQALSDIGMQGKCVLTSEIKETALKVYKDNFGDENIVGDISKVDSKDIPDFDMLLAGFPCQPFSAAGKRRGFEDTRGTLFFEVARILKDKKPKYFLLENVENLVWHDMTREEKKQGKKIGRTFETILNVLEDLGYKVSWRVLQASRYGVPQIRRRVYIVGSLKEEIELGFFKEISSCFGDIQEHGLPTVDSEFSRLLKEYLKCNNLPLSYVCGKYIRDKRGSENNIHSWELGLRGKLNENQIQLLNDLIYERRKKSRAIEKGVPLKDGVGLTYEELKDIYIGNDFENDLDDIVSKKYLKKYKINGYPNDVYDILGGCLSFEFTRFIKPNESCLTLVATDACKLGVVDGDGVRQLTLKECLRLDGYPDDYKFDVPYRVGLDLLGNTVVVPVIKMICERILESYE